MNKKIALSVFGRMVFDNTLEDYGITATELSVHNPLNGVCQLYDKPAITLPYFPINNRHERRRLEKKYKKNNKRNSNYTQPLKRKRRK